MKILGVDPGMADTGWAVLEQLPNPPGHRLDSSGIIRTSPPQVLPERLNIIHKAISELLLRFAPDMLAIEEMFFLQAAHSVRATLQARGVILLAAAQANVPVFEYNPRQVKSALTGSGSAQKSQMQKMVQRTLGLDAELKPDDVSDAAAIALCHLRMHRSKNMRVLDKIGGNGFRNDLLPARAKPRDLGGQRSTPVLRKS